MPFVAHQMHSGICPVVISLQKWKFEIRGIVGIPDFLCERSVIDVIHISLTSAASLEAFNETTDPIAFEKLLQVAEI